MKDSASCRLQSEGCELFSILADKAEFRTAMMIARVVSVVGTARENFPNDEDVKYFGLEFMQKMFDY